MTVTLPVLPLSQWLDGTVNRTVASMRLEPCDLARLLQVIADVICAEQD